MIREVPEPNFGPGPDEPDRANQFAAHGHDVMAEDMFHTGPSPRLFLIAGLLSSR
jgi:hypothetical protein